ncbi:hypothetical protein HG535_0B06690 [Zygotorulaspora mrakii]|uniref:Biogenesis of lysosome-related organelles complex 1 subunit 1 n=1 Tax=Zygotorulaspora mrakii TaxID=42260 RepID=A0A7H9AZH3_ZYGMR|nr:uncharacterized protein HG535_0B06690 [Zygotorulaspora mrakii]QLG71623.1 hypothetical protein HG535_0B06690 [Zygotorulaspora mrakii]
MPNKSDLDQLVNRICKSSRETECSKVLKEIESNNEYITNVQLKKLLKLHDISFKDKCVLPAQSLYDKCNECVIQDGDLQNWAELIDRDVRVLEESIQLIKENKR